MARLEGQTWTLESSKASWSPGGDTHLNDISENAEWHLMGTVGGLTTVSFGKATAAYPLTGAERSLEHSTHWERRAG